MARRLSPVWVCGAVLLVSGGAVHAAPTELIVNGEFESPSGITLYQGTSLPGWSTEAADGRFELWGQGFMSSPTTGSDGDPTGQHLELTSTYSANNYQVVTIPVTNARADLSFDWWQRNAGESVIYTVTGSKSGTIASGTATSGSTSAWTRFTLSDLAVTPGENVTVAFRSAGSAHIDQVSFGSFRDAAGSVVLVNQKFTGALPTSGAVAWASSDGAFELYNSGSAGPRAMSTTYDHDNDPATPVINLQGAAEINANSGHDTLSATFTMPSGIGTDALLSFFAGYRGNTLGTGLTVPTVALYDVTAGQYLLSPVNVEINATHSVWQYNAISLQLDPASFGHTVRLDFYGGGTGGGDGLELTDLSFTAAVPTPAALPMGLTLLGLLAAKRRRR